MIILNKQSKYKEPLSLSFIIGSAIRLNIWLRNLFHHYLVIMDKLLYELICILILDLLFQSRIKIRKHRYSISIKNINYHNKQDLCHFDLLRFKVMNMRCKCNETSTRRHSDGISYSNTNGA